jgi:UPF0176 protein
MLTVAAFYHFAALPDAPARVAPLKALAVGLGLRGSVILATEGVNGTIAGEAAGVAALVSHLRGWPGLAALTHKESRAEAQPFGRMKVKLRTEIVTMGLPGVDPAAGTGTYVGARDWNAVISAPDVAVIDTRNAYEVALGTFAGAVDPGTGAFRDFPGWWAANAARFAGKRIAMFCTGGIRCEKATNWLIGQGVPQVMHLRGGILTYLEDVPQAESLWQGACFVFDDRVSVGHGLVPGDHVICGACRRPVPDTTAPGYDPGVACPACADDYDAADRARFRERHRQMQLAASRGDRHLGA